MTYILRVVGSNDSHLWNFRNLSTNLIWNLLWTFQSNWMVASSGAYVGCIMMMIKFTITSYSDQIRFFFDKAIFQPITNKSVNKYHNSIPTVQIAFLHSWSAQIMNRRTGFLNQKTSSMTVLPLFVVIKHFVSRSLFFLIKIFEKLETSTILYYVHRFLYVLKSLKLYASVIRLLGLYYVNNR